MILKGLNNERNIKKIYYGYITLVPCLMIFMPDIILGVMAISSFLMIFLNIKLMKKVIKYNYNYLLVIFVIYTFLVAIFNNNNLGIISSIMFLMMIIYIMYLRYVMNKKIFNVMTYIIGFGSIFSYLYIKIDSKYVLTNMILNILRNNFHLNFDYFYNTNIQTASTFFNRNYFGYIVAIVIILMVFRLFYSLKNIKNNKLYLIDIVLVPIFIYFNLKSLVISESRGAYLALIVGLVILLVMMFNSLTLAIVLLGIYVLLNINSFINIIPRIESVIPSFHSRLYLWHKGMSYVADNPLFGGGFYIMLNNEGVVHSHNIFIESLVCFGLIGLFIVISFVVLSMIDKIKNWINNKNHFIPLIVSLLVATLVHGFNDMILFSPSTFILFGIMYSFMEIDVHKD